MDRGRVITARGLALLAAGTACLVAAVLLGAPVLAYLGLLFLLLVAAALLSLVLPRARGTVTRSVSTDLLTVGRTSRVDLRVSLKGRLIRRASWTDSLPSAVSGTAQGLLLGAGSDNGRSLELSYDLRGIRRGVWRLGPMVLRTRDPFGLVERRHRMWGTREITIVPELVTLPHLLTLLGGTGGDSRTLSSRHGQSSDNLSPRAYVPGDSMRRIHWRATARRGTLMVRREEDHAGPGARIVLDLRPSRWAASGETPDPLLERTITACASLATMLADGGYVVEVSDAAGTVLGALRGGEEDLDELLLALAQAAPHGPEDPPHTGGPGRDPVVVFTGLLASAEAAPPHPIGSDATIIAADPRPGALEALQHAGWGAHHLDEVIHDA